MTLRFGTDGIRGVANVDLTPELVTALGRAAARVLGGPFVVGRDTRRSGPMLEAALVAGLAAEGVDVARLGVVPTPGVAFGSQVREVPGAMISASHNPFPDNGIKFFARGGRKLSDELEARLEEELLGLRGAAQETTAPGDRTAGGDVGAAVGTVVDAPEHVDEYVGHLVGALAGRDLTGVSVVLDCGNGSASGLAPRVFRELGATVSVLNDAPDGENVNAGCGSTDPTGLQREVVARGAHAGLAFDGDADRVIAVDETGALVDGDHILAVTALDLAARERLPGAAVVATVMSNFGLRRALSERGIRLVETPVGDRHVGAAMEAEGLVLGGEQSGHVIFADFATTGDGTLTGLLLVDAVRRAGEPLSELAGVVTKLPQLLVNVRVASRGGLDAAAGFWADVADAERELAGVGRVLVRPSGTEPVVRVMVEAPTEQQAAELAGRLAERLERELGSPEQP
jgi:phosphoglucosamine mutase